VTARLARGGPPRNRVQQKGRPRSVSTRRSKKPSLLESIGIAPGTTRRISGWIFAGMLVTAFFAALLIFQVPQMIAGALSRGVGQAGFTFSRVEVRGQRRVSRPEIYNIVFDQNQTPMPSVDLAIIRNRLLQIGWIKEARVSRRLPDTIVVDVVERQPAAIWQHGGQLNLIDAEGIVLQRLRGATPDLPLLLGTNANRNFARLNILLDAAPHLRPQVADASWIGDRRWDVRFQTGEILSLPEGDVEARRAINRFAGMDQQSQLLGRGFARFDMRNPGQMTVRISREPGTRVPAVTPPHGQPGQSAAELARTI
jgi:cell division protein FtsQ